MNKEQIEKANKINLAEYLLSEGEPLIKEGAYYRHRDHDSLKFKGNLYYWNSQDDKGDAIKYLMTYQNMSFRMAVVSLIGSNLVGEPITKVERSAFSWGDIKLSEQMQRVFAYLNKSRGISYPILQRLTAEMLLFQELETNNALFPIYDENRQIVGAESAGTLTGKRFKGIKSGSKYGYGYSVPVGDSLDYVLFFESAIDLLSFMDHQQEIYQTGKGYLLISMGGLKDNIIASTLDRLKGGFKPFLCVDNDQAGNEFINAMKGKFGRLGVYRPPSMYKDWNELLLAVKENQ